MGKKQNKSASPNKTNPKGGNGIKNLIWRLTISIFEIFKFKTFLGKQVNDLDSTSLKPDNTEGILLFVLSKTKKIKNKS